MSAPKRFASLIGGIGLVGVLLAWLAFGDNVMAVVSTVQVSTLPVTSVSQCQRGPRGQL